MFILPTLLVQFESLNIIVPYLSKSSSLNNKNAGTTLVLSHKDHNSNITYGKEIGTKKTRIIPIDIVYLQRDTTQRKELVDLLHCYKSTHPPSNTFPEFAQPDQSTSGLNPKSISPRSESSDSTDSNIPIVVHKGVRSCTKDPLSNYKSYKNLSPNFHVFASQVSYIEIPKSV